MRFRYYSALLRAYVSLPNQDERKRMDKQYVATRLKRHKRRYLFCRRVLRRNSTRER